MSADSKASNSKFLKGTLILTASSIVVKVIGSLNWIILSRVLGGEGIGLYQMGFPIYLMAITVSSAGVPVAISIITSEKLANKDYRGAKRVFNVSLRVLLLTGLLFSSSLFFGADWLVNNHIIRDSRAYYSIIALAPAVFFVTFLASFRGYLQGWQIMTPTAVSRATIFFSDMTNPLHGIICTSRAEGNKKYSPPRNILLSRRDCLSSLLPPCGDPAGGKIRCLFSLYCCRIRDAVQRVYEILTRAMPFVNGKI